MNKISKAVAVLMMFAAIVSLTFAMKNGLGHDSLQSEMALPPGKWTFAAHADFLPGHGAVPVITYSVTTESNKGLRNYLKTIF